MSAKRQLLTQAQYDALALSFEWTKVELGLATIQGTPGVQRKADLLDAFGSGDANAAKPLNGQNAIFGMDGLIKRPICAEECERNEAEVFLRGESEARLALVFGVEDPPHLVGEDKVGRALRGRGGILGPPLVSLPARARGGVKKPVRYGRSLACQFSAFRAELENGRQRHIRERTLRGRRVLGSA